MSNRDEKRFLWFLVLLVGVGVCVFSFTGETMIRFVFLPLGVFLVVVSAYRMRRLGRKIEPWTSD